MIKKGIAVDIDETLSWTLKYWVEKMMDKFGNPENLTVIELIKKYRYSQNVPYWQTPEAEKWMEEHRNANAVQELLPIIEGSPLYLNKINHIIPISMYLTIRPENVRLGTLNWLKKHGFPNAQIVMRPHNIHMKDGNEWKAKILKKYYPKIVGIIDDNPAVLKYLSPDYEGAVFLFDSNTSERQDIDVYPCPSWQHVYDFILKKFQGV